VKSRIDIEKVAPEAIKPLLDLGAYIHRSGLDRQLVNLVLLRASQINGCAYCIDMHTKDARAEGETEQRLYGLDAWRETPFYTDRERAALAWTEAVTLVSQGHVPDDVYEEARRHFSEKELVDLNMAVVVINAWNRVAISFRAVPGTYQPTPRRQARSAS
jgi:AhpD family alkylhydroperoxidase